MNGSRKAFAVTDFMGSTISTARCVRGNFLGRIQKSLKLVTCHLGNGCSISAVQKAAASTRLWASLPLDGLMMGTRSGAVDPGILTSSNA